MIKMFTMFESETVCMMYLLDLCFNKGQQFFLKHVQKLRQIKGASTSLLIISKMMAPMKCKLQDTARIL